MPFKMNVFFSFLIGLVLGGALFPEGTLLPGPTWTYVVIYSAFKWLTVDQHSQVASIPPPPSSSCCHFDWSLC